MITVTIERPSDEELVVRIGKREIIRANHDEHGWLGMDLLRQTFRALASAGYCVVREAAK
jgi:hypothetical protein